MSGSRLRLVIGGAVAADRSTEDNGRWRWGSPHPRCAADGPLWFLFLADRAGTEVKAREIMTAGTSPAGGSPVHPVACGFRAAAARFEQGRPVYPVAAVSHLLDVLHITAGSTVVDLGAGTGKLTRALAPAEARVIAVEPLPEMRRELLAAVPGVPVVGGVAEALPLMPGSVDVLVAAQSWHWFDGARAVLEADRVLVPGGRLGLVWSAYDESVPWLGELVGIRARRAIPGAPDHRTGAWRAAFEQGTRWRPLRQRDFRHTWTASPEAVVDNVLSTSFLALLPAQEQVTVEDEVRRLLGRHQRTGDGARVRLPLLTQVYSTSKRDTSSSTGFR
jgi:SAM-dependent methyltransferase